MSMFIKACLRVAVIGVALLVLSPNTAIAQMSYSFSSYDDEWGSPWSTGADVLWSDNSSGCNHSDYFTEAWLSGPSGSTYSTGFMGAGASLNAAEGDFSFTSQLWVNCSCAGYVSAGVSPAIEWPLRKTTTYYTNPTKVTGFCVYSSTACSTGSSPSCVTGLQADWPDNDPCAQYTWAYEWAIRKDGNWQCVGSIFGFSAQGPGTCT